MEESVFKRLDDSLTSFNTPSLMFEHLLKVNYPCNVREHKHPSVFVVFLLESLKKSDIPTPGLLRVEKIHFTQSHPYFHQYDPIQCDRKKQNAVRRTDRSIEKSNHDTIKLLFFLCFFLYSHTVRVLKLHARSK